MWVWMLLKLEVAADTDDSLLVIADILHQFFVELLPFLAFENTAHRFQVVRRVLLGRLCLSPIGVVHAPSSFTRTVPYGDDRGQCSAPRNV